MKRAPYRRRKPKVLPGPPYLPCGQCSHGWLTTQDGTAYRCGCFIRFHRERDERRARGEA